MECASLEASLEHYASSARQPRDEALEDACFQAGVAIYNRAVEMLERARQVEIPCYDLPGESKLHRFLLFTNY